MSTQVFAPYSTVGSIIRNIKEYGTTVNLSRSGAPRKISLRFRRHLRV